MEKHNVAVYGDGTIRVLDAMRNGAWKNQQDGVQFLTEEQQIMPENHTWLIVREAREHSRETNLSLAKRLGTSPVQLTYVRNEAKYHGERKMPRDLVLQSLLLRDAVPSWEQADHILMECGLPGLFTKTCKNEANRRNFVIGKVFDLASCARNGDSWSWAVVLQAALQCFQLKETADRKYLAEYEDQITAAGEKYRALFAAWRPEFDALVETDYQTFRAEKLEEYRKGLTGEAAKAPAETLRNALGIAGDVVKRFFERMDIQRNLTSRELLIEIAAEMGCSLADVNRMLMETNRCFIYPRSHWAEEREFAMKFV